MVKETSLQEKGQLVGWIRVNESVWGYSGLPIPYVYFHSMSAFCELFDILPTLLTHWVAP
eukprot:1155693-Pelagomonas_calceolata.AAC.2